MGDGDRLKRQEKRSKLGNFFSFAKFYFNSAISVKARVDGNKPIDWK
jgi:hypothetical protein